MSQRAVEDELAEEMLKGVFGSGDQVLEDPLRRTARRSANRSRGNLAETPGFGLAGL